MDQSGVFMDNPFLPPSANSHNQFVPVKIGGTLTAYPTVRIPKPPKPPEKPLMPYMRYSRKVWDSVKANHPDLKLWEIGKVIGQMWRELNSSEKQRFIEEYEVEKIEHAEALKSYQNSPAYQQYLAAKERVQEDKDVKNRVPVVEGKLEARFVLPPCEIEDDDLEYFSVRHLSSLRFQRNHKLMQEIFNDNVTPDSRSIIMTQRLVSLKRQVENLVDHQRKLEDELIVLENKFQSKKRSIEESSNNFQDKIAKLKKPAIENEVFEKLVESEEKKLLNQYHNYLKRVEQANKSTKIIVNEPKIALKCSVAKEVSSVNGEREEEVLRKSTTINDEDSMDGSSSTGLANGHTLDDDSVDTFGDSSDA